MYIRILLSLALAVLTAGLAPVAFAQQLLYIHADHLNTPRLVTNGSGTPVWRWDQIEPFGDNLPNEDPDGNSALGHLPLRFPGQYFDKETNLAYNYLRDYDAAIGRYIQSDPIGLRGGLNTFAYVHGNPLGLSDPTGQMSQADVNTAQWLMDCLEACNPRQPPMSCPVPVFGAGPEQPRSSFMCLMSCLGLSQAAEDTSRSVTTVIQTMNPPKITVVPTSGGRRE